MRISVVIPCKDKYEEVKRCLESVLNQTVSQPFEVLLVENNSRDVSVIPKLVSALNDDRIKHHYIENCDNANVARNYGAKHAKGKYLAFLDSDDLWKPNHLSSSLKLAEQGYPAIYSGYFLNDGKKEKKVSSRQIEKDETGIQFLFSQPRSVAQTSSFFLEKDIFKFKQWNESLNRNQDYDFFIQVQKDFPWVFKKELTSVVRWEIGAKRNFNTEAFKKFYDKYCVEMNTEQKSSYLVETLAALAKYDENGFLFFKQKFIKDGKINNLKSWLITRNYHLSKAIFYLSNNVKKYINFDYGN